MHTKADTSTSSSPGTVTKNLSLTLFKQLHYSSGKLKART
jgi:hypothetical protein